MLEEWGKKSVRGWKWLNSRIEPFWAIFRIPPLLIFIPNFSITERIDTLYVCPLLKPNGEMKDITFLFFPCT